MAGTRYAEGGAAVREARRELGISQADLAERIGRGQAYISKIETGEAAPGRDTLILLARELGRSFDVTLWATPDPAEAETLELPVMNLRLVVVESHPTGALVPRIIGVNGDEEPRETAEQMLEMARAEFARLERKPGLLAVHPAEDELVAAYERGAARGVSYYAFRIDADGIARKSRPGRIQVEPLSRTEMERGEVKW